MATPLPKIVEWYSLTEMVNEMKTPNAFIRNLLFGNERNLHTENIVYKVRTKGRVAAPFVEKCGEAVIAGGFNDIERNFTAPNIRVKAPFEACDLLFTRRPGTSIFIDEAEHQQVIEDEIADHLQTMEDEIANAEEWLCAQALRGTINYVSTRAAFSADMLKPAANNLVASTFWDLADPDYALDVFTAKRRMHDEVSLPITHAIMGADALTTFYAAIGSDAALARLFDTNRFVTGSLDVTRQFENSGAIFVGSAFGIDWWGYTREVEILGSSEALIRDKFVEFVHAGPSAQNQMLYAAIPDLGVIRQGGGPLARKRFSKSWEQEDPSELYVLIHTRPMPVMKRPGSVVSMQVVS